MTEYDTVPVEFECTEPLPVDMPLFFGSVFVGKVARRTPCEISMVAGSKTVRVTERVYVLPVKGLRAHAVAFVMSLDSFVRLLGEDARS